MYASLVGEMVRYGDGKRIEDEIEVAGKSNVAVERTIANLIEFVPNRIRNGWRQEKK